VKRKKVKKKIGRKSIAHQSGRPTIRKQTVDIEWGKNAHAQRERYFCSTVPEGGRIKALYGHLGNYIRNGKKKDLTTSTPQGGLKKKSRYRKTRSHREKKSKCGSAAKKLNCQSSREKDAE